MDIKSVIRAHGYTIEKVAQQWKPEPITKGALSKSISNNPTVATLRTIAAVIGCPVAEFFSDETPQAAPTHVCPHCGKPITIAITKE